MITNAQLAWVIHKSWSGDTSARVVFFTQEQGLVSCFYKGGRTPKKQALLQSFSPLWLAMDVRGDAHYVRQLELAATPLHFTGQSLFAGLYVNELLHHALKPNDPNLRLHAAYTSTLQALMISSNRIAIETVLRRFEWVLLTSCGYHMSLSNDARSAEPIVVDSCYHFVAGEGFVLADEGINGAHIIAMSNDKKAIDAIFQNRNHALDGKEIKARALYQNLIK